jgi:hypothetical protein
MKTDDITTTNKQQQEIEYLKKQVAELQALLKSKDDSPKKPKSKIPKKESKIEIVETLPAVLEDGSMDKKHWTRSSRQKFERKGIVPSLKENESIFPSLRFCIGAPSNDEVNL